MEDCRSFTSSSSLDKRWARSERASAAPLAPGVLERLLKPRTSAKKTVLIIGGSCATRRRSLCNLEYTGECTEETTMKSVALAEANDPLRSLVDEVRSSGEPIEIREQGEPAAYLVEVETFKRLRGIEDSVRTEQLRRDLEGPRYDLEDVLAKLGLDP